MRVNVYAEEMTDRVEIVTKEIEGQEFTGVRFYLYLPVSNGKKSVQGPFIHREGDDDSAAVTFWGKAALKTTLQKALSLLEEHHEEKSEWKSKSGRPLRNPKLAWYKKYDDDDNEMWTADSPYSNDEDSIMWRLKQRLQGGKVVWYADHDSELGDDWEGITWLTLEAAKKAVLASHMAILREHS